MLDLSLVVHVEATESNENSMFEFEVHFSHDTGSPWRLKAYTKVCFLIYIQSVEKLKVWSFIVI